jgi:hypothetical protein
MFAPNSRYAALETTSLTTPDGREIAYVRRRFLPRGKDLPKLAEATVEAYDRIDLLAARTLGDPESFWRICDANDAIAPAELIEAGRRLTIPMPQP